jgi:hypothetical protein
VSPKAVARSLRERAEIRRIWLELHRQRPFARHCAKDVAQRLSFKLSTDAISWHLRALDAATEADSTGSFRAAECSSDLDAA